MGETEISKLVFAQLEEKRNELSEVNAEYQKVKSELMDSRAHRNMMSINSVLGKGSPSGDPTGKQARANAKIQNYHKERLITARTLTKTLGDKLQSLSKQKSTLEEQLRNLQDAHSSISIIETQANGLSKLSSV